MFTHDNTEGFDEQDLEEMNLELIDAMKGIDPDDRNYHQIYKHESEKILDNWCVV